MAKRLVQKRIHSLIRHHGTATARRTGCLANGHFGSSRSQ
ncbi:hypothetical protein I551_4253 [Mycobacterium ulcerans str. Harvey]|uniref:Uncharacterized protein n=1 Tax=Mycobacterium ulcerans str. Harvey TaxID=1299332 RepID=A0ABN0QX21_MYCUL|nr:hypothetical protein I551_4253 [Mycobacterium ulcerans str. Harvey]